MSLRNMWRNLSCGEIPPHNRFAWHFSFLMWRNLSCGKFLHMTDFSTFLHITHFAPHLSCGELSLCDRFSSHFSCGETSPHDNLSYGKFSPHDKFFLHNHRLWCVWQISGMGLHWVCTGGRTWFALGAGQWGLHWGLDLDSTGGWTFGDIRLRAEGKYCNAEDWIAIVVDACDIA